MVKRLLNAHASDFTAMNARDLAESIRLSEGRTVAAEIVAIAPPLLDGVSNAELAAAMGADLILLNLYDVTQPQVTGFSSKGETAGLGKVVAGMGITLADVRRLTGRPVGLNLEPIENPEAVTTSGRPRYVITSTFTPYVALSRSDVKASAKEPAARSRPSRSSTT